MNIEQLQADLARMLDDRDALLARIEEADGQKPALYVAFSDCGQFIRYWTRDPQCLAKTLAVRDFPVHEFYARPIPAAPAVAVPYVPFSDDDMAEIHQLAYELGGTDGGEYSLDGEQLEQVIVKAASLFYKPASQKPAVAVPALQKAADHEYSKDSLVALYQAWELLPCCNLMAMIGGVIQDIQWMRENLTDEARALLQSAPHPANHSGDSADMVRRIPEGWSILRHKTGEIKVIHDDGRAVSVKSDPLSARIIPEAILWALADDMLKSCGQPLGNSEELSSTGLQLDGDPK